MSREDPSDICSAYDRTLLQFGGRIFTVAIDWATYIIARMEIAEEQLDEV